MYSHQPFLSSIWKVIHIFAKNMTQEQSESFLTFMECLTILIPHEESRKNLSSYMAQNNPEYSVSNMFEWTVKLHSFINVIRRRRGQVINELTVRQAFVLYDNMKSKKDWGNPIWYMLHYFAANLPDRPTKQHIIAFKALINTLTVLLPCAVCRNNLIMNLKFQELNINNYTTSNQSLFIWSVKLHNVVNSELGKPEFDLEEAWKMYRIDESTYSLIDM